VTVTSEPGKGSVFTVRLPGGGSAENRLAWVEAVISGPETSLIWSTQPPT
jgi:hypothetical protein